MNAWRVVLWSALAAVLVMMVAGCAMPERVITATTYDDGTTATITVSREIGYQLYWGERHDMQSGPGVANASDVSKTTMGSVATAAIGAAAGAYIGGMPGAVLGGVGGAAAGKLSGDKTTTGTAQTLAGALPATATSSGRMDVDSLLNPASLGAMSPDAREALKAYIRANPEQCRLCQIIGQENVFRLIDGLGGTIQ